MTLCQHLLILYLKKISRMSVKTKEEKLAKIRFCIGCGALRPKHEMIRVVRNANGEAALDRVGNADGRGCYICCDKLCYELALKKKGFNRSLRLNILPLQLKEEIATEIHNRFK